MIVKYTILIIYFAFLFLLGILASRRVKNLSDYYVGGKKLGFWVVAFSSRATGESSWLLLGLTGMGAMVGLQAMWVVVGEVLGVTLGWLLMARRFKRLSDRYDSITIPDYLVSRFRSKTPVLRTVAAIALGLFVTIYVSAQIDATGKAFETFLQWDYFLGAFVGFLIVVAYITIGGFVAVAWSDLFQGVIMLFALVLLPIVAFFWIAEPMWAVQGSLNSIDSSLFEIWGKGGLTLTNIMTCIGFLFIGVGFLGSPQVFVRFMSIKDDSEIKKGRWVAIIYTLLATSAAVGIGMLGRWIFTSFGDNPESILGPDSENVLPMLVDRIMPLTLVGIYIAAVLAAIMSTIDSLLVLASSAITRDFWQKIMRPNLSDEGAARISSWVTVGLALFALAIAMVVAVVSPTRSIFWFVIFGWSGIAATFCPTMILSLAWKGFTEKGAIAAMITGFVSVPLFKFVIPEIAGIGPYIDKLGELPSAFVMGFSAAIVVSLIWPDPELAKEVRLKE
jgi:sodium/proline symporter